MEFIRSFIDIVLHLDKHLFGLSQDYGIWLYAILFAIIFCETGLVVTPLLPGDSLLFAVGALAVSGALDITLVIILLSIAAILGDTVNYFIGHQFGDYLINHPSKFIKKEYLDKTHSFYEEYGGKTIILARFVPIVRTFAPFVGGLGAMTYSKFIIYNIVGGLVWIISLTLAGYFFGTIPVVKKNFSLVVFGIIGVSLLPMVYEIIKARYISNSKGSNA
ncbi:MAG: DedA family protein [Chloroherpetonaceae bacterium]|nr:DedA family protein [Chloroherpetonaceae bacterium]